MWVAEGPGERMERARRKLLSAIATSEPATLNDVAKVVGRGAPAVSRSVDALVRAGLVERTQDPDNRRRLALRLTQTGRDQLAARLESLAKSHYEVANLRNVQVIVRLIPETKHRAVCFVRGKHYSAYHEAFFAVGQILEIDSQARLVLGKVHFQIPGVFAHRWISDILQVGHHFLKVLIDLRVGGWCVS